jgi:hypothetical protein
MVRTKETVPQLHPNGPRAAPHLCHRTGRRRYRLIHWKDPTARGSIGSVFPPGLAQLKATPSILLVTGALFVLVKSPFDHGVELGEFGVD